MISANLITLNRIKRGGVLGKYRLISPLGSGSFSEVWKALDTIEDQFVALKIPTSVVPDTESEEELLKEIHLNVQLQHPNILRIRNADLVDGLYLLSSDLATESLDDRLTRRIGTRKALSYIQQIISGLAHAHSSKVIHRDIKPLNLMVFHGDIVRIADFGLAMKSNRTLMSATGSGTPMYAAPEQIHGFPSLASDVFSVGLIAHELLTGRLPRWPFKWPFNGSESLQNKVPSEIISIIRKACHKDYQQRFPTAIEMLQAWERAQPAVKRFLEPQTKPKRRKKKIGLWKALRFREFDRAYSKALNLKFLCPTCDGPISEHMAGCPWCGEAHIRIGEGTDYPSYCKCCTRGLKDEWLYCPWCWRAALPGGTGIIRKDSIYCGTCRSCKGPLSEGMKYCPWCHKKSEKPTQVEELTHRCSSCRGSVSNDFWEYCPWCIKSLA